MALEWDPLSTDYLLMVNTYHGIRLIDTQSLSVISKFQLPSVAAQVHTLAWIHTAPGMFLTGGLCNLIIYCHPFQIYVLF